VRGSQVGASRKMEEPAADAGKKEKNGGRKKKLKKI
jgi:hypothetical protein